MRVHVYERGDETLMVFASLPSPDALPRTTGAAVALGACEVDEALLSAFVRERLAAGEACAVAGRDADAVRQALQGPIMPPPRAAPGAPILLNDF